MITVNAMQGKSVWKAAMPVSAKVLNVPHSPAEDEENNIRFVKSEVYGQAPGIYPPAPAFYMCRKISPA